MVRRCWRCFARYPEKKIWQQSDNSFAPPPRAGIAFGHTSRGALRAHPTNAREEASPMRHTITNNAPVSAFAAAGVCTVKAAARTRAITLPVVSQLAARFPQVHQAQISAIKVSPKGAYMG